MVREGRLVERVLVREDVVSHAAGDDDVDVAPDMPGAAEAAARSGAQRLPRRAERVARVVRTATDVNAEAGQSVTAAVATVPNLNERHLEGALQVDAPPGIIFSARVGA